MKFKFIDDILAKDMRESISLKQTLIDDTVLKNSFYRASKLIIQKLKNNKKILIIGNGGSAADSQHFAAELSSKFQKKRKHLSALALTTDTSVISSIANDFGYKYIFSKQIDAIANNKDILIAFTTSCRSKNIINAINFAYKKDIKIILFCGKNVPYNIKKKVNVLLSINSTSIPRIQESHLFLYHTICKIVDNNF